MTDLRADMKKAVEFGVARFAPIWQRNWEKIMAESRRMTDRELMQMALDALEKAQDYTSCPTYSPSMTQQCAIAAVALRARLAQPEPEPHGYLWFTGHMEQRFTHRKPKECERIGDVKPVYTAPPQREWQGLTDEEIQQIEMSASSKLSAIYLAEAKLKGKNAL